MTTIHMTEAQARKAGLLTDEIPKERAKREKWFSRCTSCDEVIEGETRATRHNVETGHCKFESVL